MTDAETIRARFEISGWEPTALEAGSGSEPWLDGVTMRKRYTEGIVGESVALFVSSGTEESRAYIATERVTGALPDGRSGSFTVYHGALDDPGDSSAFGWVIGSTGTGDFAEWSGTARIEHDDAGAVLVLTLG